MPQFMLYAISIGKKIHFVIYAVLYYYHCKYHYNYNFNCYYHYYYTIKINIKILMKIIIWFVFVGYNFITLFTHFIAAREIASTTNEIKTPTNDKTTTVKMIPQYNRDQEQDVTTRIFFKLTSSLSISSDTKYVYKDLSSVNTQRQIYLSTVTATEKHDNELALSHSTYPMYVYIIPLIGIFIIIIVVSNILVIFHRRKICSNTNSTHRLQIKKRNVEFDSEKMSTHTTNQPDTNNSQYEMIYLDSDDSDLIKCLKIDSSFETNNQQSALSSSFISRPNVIMDPDGYQCPVSSETINKAISMDTSLSNYLTVVQNV